jgi:hypothetical protein
MNSGSRRTVLGFCASGTNNKIMTNKSPKILLSTGASPLRHICYNGDKRSSSTMSVLSCLRPSCSLSETTRRQSLKTTRTTLMNNSIGMCGWQSSIKKISTATSISTRCCFSLATSYELFDTTIGKRRMRRRLFESNASLPIEERRTPIGTTNRAIIEGKNVAIFNLPLFQYERIRYVPGNEWDHFNTLYYHQKKLTMPPPNLWITNIECNNLPRYLSRNQKSLQSNYFGQSTPLILQTSTKAVARTTTGTRYFTTTTVDRPPPIFPVVWQNNHHQRLLCNSSYSMVISSSSCRIQLPIIPRSMIRFVTTNNNNNKGDGKVVEENNNNNSTPTDHHHPPSTSSSSVVSAAATAASNNLKGLVDSTVSSVRPIVGSAEATIKRAVQEWNTSDLISVYGIVFLIIAIVTAPLMARYVPYLHTCVCVRDVCLFVCWLVGSYTHLVKIQNVGR